MSDSRDVWTVGDVLNAMSGSTVPHFMVRVIQEVQQWLGAAVSAEYPLAPIDFPQLEAEHPGPAELDYLLERLEWVMDHADLVPTRRGMVGRPDAIILSVGTILLDEGLRMMVDHAALFARKTVKRVWVVSDTWVIGDVLAYMPHINALQEQGVTLRFMLVTPWGHSEIPWNKP